MIRKRISNILSLKQSFAFFCYKEHDYYQSRKALTSYFHIESERIDQVYETMFSDLS